MEDNARKKVYWLWLCNINGIGYKKIELLLSEYGTPENIYKQKEIAWFTEKEKTLFAQSKKMKWVDKYNEIIAKGIDIVTIDDTKYPKRLDCLADRPYILYVKGRLPAEDKPTCGIVGARNCTRYGAEFAKSVGRLLGENDIQVISGMAKGIDGESQKGALAGGGDSFGVLGCGVDICYPAGNWRIYEDLQTRGGLISEFLPGTEPMPGFFPMRNRIISALSDKLIVVEAKEKSGSLITVDFALEQGKDIFGVPGRITDPLSKGVNNLIKQGAGVLTSPEDILFEYKADLENFSEKCKKEKNYLAERENMLYSNLDLQPKNLQTIIVETGLGIVEISDILLELQLKGLVVECGKNYYARSQI